MKYITQIFSENEFDSLYEAGIRNLILNHKELSLRGNLDNSSVLNILKKNDKDKNVQIYLDCNIPLRQSDFIRVSEQIKSLIAIGGINVIRIKDIGLARHISSYLQNFSGAVKIQLLLDSGNRNIESVKEMINYFGNICCGVVLSNEVPGNLIKYWLEVLKIETELLVLGPIKIFSSKRHLLKGFFNNKDLSLPVKAESDESGYLKRFDVEDSIHGTSFFHECELSLLKYIKQLKDYGLTFARIDRFSNRDKESLLKILNLINSEENINSDEVGKIRKKRVINGFFVANKTDASLNKLKNEIRNQRDETLVAAVTEAARDKYIVIYTFKEIELNAPLYFINPLGVSIPLPITEVRDCSGNKAPYLEEGRLYVLPYTKGITSQSYLYVG